MGILLALWSFQFSNIHWLSLTNSVERIFSLFEALITYFKFEAKAPKTHVDFLSKPLSKVYLFLAHNVQYFSSKRIMYTERRANSIIKVLHWLKEFVECVRERIDEKCFPLCIKSVVKMNNITYEQEKKFWLEVGNYFGICQDYNLKWISSLKKFDLVTDVPEYYSIKKTRKRE